MRYHWIPSRRAGEARGKGNSVFPAAKMASCYLLASRAAAEKPYATIVSDSLHVYLKIMWVARDYRGEKHFHPPSYVLGLHFAN